MTSTRKCEGVVRRCHATWCEWCDKPAQYEAEALSRRAVDVCSMDAHSIRLTGRYHRIRKMKK